MTAFPRLVRGLGQPAGLVEVDRARSLASGLRVAFVGGRELAAGSPVVLTGGTWAADRNGRHWLAPGDGSLIELPAIKLQYTTDGYDELTVVALGEFYAPGGSNAICSYTSEDGGNYGWTLKAEQWADTGEVGFTHHGTAGADVTSGVPTPSGFAFVGVSATQQGHQFLINDSASALVGPNLVYSGPASRFRIGIGRGSNDPIQGGSKVHAVFVWERALSLAELRALRRDPYQVLKPVLGRFYSLPTAPSAYLAALLEASTSSGDFGASAVALSQWDESSYALESILGGAVAAVILESALSALSAYQEAAIASAGVSDTSPAEDGLSGRGVASVGIIDSASATDERSGRGIAVAGVDENTPASDSPQTSSAIPVEFSSPLTGDEIVDAVADVNAYVLEGISAGEAWASSVLALAALVSSVSAGSVLSAASSSTLSRAVVENTPASSGFVSSVVALADLVSNGDAVSALLAAVVSTTAIAESATSGSAFSAGYFEASPASVTETALPASVVSAVAVVEASFAGISPSASALSAVAAVSVAWMSAGSAVAVFSALDRGAARYVLAAIQIRAILSASIEINPAANVVVEINPRS